MINKIISNAEKLLLKNKTKEYNVNGYKRMTKLGNQGTIFFVEMKSELKLEQ